MTIPHPRASWIDPATGQRVAHGEMLRRVATRRAVLLGESHDIAEIHRWQLHVACGLHALQPDMAIGVEMFPRRLQPVLDRWVAGELATEDFLREAEWDAVWGFPPEIYLPLFHFCRQFRIPMLALNCRRQLVRTVGQQGWAGVLPDEEDGVSLPVPATDAYRRYLFDITGGAGGRAAAPDAERFDRFVQAQQTWDRAFADNILRGLGRRSLVVGIIGRGHLEYGHGTPVQLRDLGVKEVAVLLPSERDSYDRAANAGIADAVFRIDRPEPPAQRRAAA